MNSETRIAVLEQELSKVKKELLEREQDLSLYKEEVERLNRAVSKILMGMDDDLDLIRDIFKYLVPTQFPHIKGFHFSTKFLSGMRFNGDYLDVFEQKDRFKFNLILSSSTGPGLTALLIAFLLKHGRDLGDGTAPSPVFFIEKVLEEIKAKKENESEIQIACMLIDKKTYELTYKLHGKVACFHQDGESSQVTDFKEFEGLKKKSIHLKPYDRVVLASPGLIGAQNSKGVAFSSNPILQALSEVPLKRSVHDVRNEIFHKLDLHLGGRRPLQDVSLIVVSVENKILKLV
jgi:serine phosphatase RsbU (regulator of sigma subunit)